MNNKGQTLVLFVIILPILLIIFTLVIDLGLLYIDKRNIENNVVSSIEYYFSHKSDDKFETKITDMLNKNIGDIDKIYIDNTSEYLEIKVIKNSKRLYKLLTDNSEITVTYRGYKENKKIIKG